MGVGGGEQPRGPGAAWSRAVSERGGDLSRIVGSGENERRETEPTRDR